MNITFDVVTSDPKIPVIASGLSAAVPPAVLEMMRNASVADLDALRVFASNIAEAALASSGRKLSSVNLVLSSGN